MGVLLVSLGFCNKVPQTEWLKQHLFLTILEAMKSKKKAPADPVPGEDLLPCSPSSHGRRDEGAL